MRLVTIITAIIFVVACKKEEAAPPPVKEKPTSEVARANQDRPVAPTSTKPMEDPKRPDPAAARRIEGFSTPESVLYDDQADLYLISNINGTPTDKDDNGFITQMSPEGEIKTLKWIDGGAAKVTLNAPKGMVFLGDTLYVTDIDVVRMFDRKTGEPKGEIAFPGSSFMNDLVEAGGAVYASDSGLRPDFSPSGTAAIYKIEGNKPTKLAAGAELNGPNGLVFTDQLWAVSFGANLLYQIGKDGKPANVVKLPRGGLDGVVALPDGTVLVSSWEENGVFAGKPGPDAKFEVKIPDVKSPADIGFDAKRNRVLIPLFQENAVILHPWM